MADNIFDATLDVDNDVKVNNFDWSHANNLTTQIGRITPIFCDLVPAKTSFRVNPRFGLQFMPMVFPIQTRMKARISFYRYPLRALWKDYKDFIGNFREGLEEPYIDFNSTEKLKKMGSTGSLGDYLGLPTTVVGSYGSSVQYTDIHSVLFQQDSGLYTYDISDNQGVLSGSRGVYDAGSFLKNLQLGMDIVSGSFFSLSFPDTTVRNRFPVGSAFCFSGLVPADSTLDDGILCVISDTLPDSSNILPDTCYSAIAVSTSNQNIVFDLPLSVSFNGTEQQFKLSFTSDFLSYVKAHPSETITFYVILNPFLSLGRYIEYNGSIRKWAVDFIPSSGFSVTPSG